jgi:DNA-binding transcriptional MocR family regulator
VGYTERGIPTSLGQILVTTGGQQALSLLAQAFLAPGDQVVEGPTYPGALEAFREQAAVLRCLPTGLDGLETAAKGHRIVLAYVISTFHNPTGSVRPAAARRALVKATAASAVWLIDDEVLSDLAFPGVQVPPPLAAYSDAVISVGSLSKSVWGGLRTGWVRAPEPLIARLARLLVVHNLGQNVPGQLAAAELLPVLHSLTARLAPERQARHDHLRAHLARHLPDWTCRRRLAARPCGHACRTVAEHPSPRQPCATASPSCREAASTSPGTARNTCACTSSPRPTTWSRPSGDSQQHGAPTVHRQPRPPRRPQFLSEALTRVLCRAERRC